MPTRPTNRRKRPRPFWSKRNYSAQNGQPETVTVDICEGEDGIRECGRAVDMVDETDEIEDSDLAVAVQVAELPWGGEEGEAEEGKTGKENGQGAMGANY